MLKMYQRQFQIQWTDSSNFKANFKQILIKINKRTFY